MATRSSAERYTRDSERRAVASPTPSSARWILTVAAWCALVAGVVHVVILAFRWHVLHDIQWQSREYVWLTPLAYLLYFGALATPIALLALWRPGWVPRRVVAALFASFAALAVALLFARFHPWAHALMALGVGVRLGSWLAAPSRRLGRHAAALGSAVLIVGGGGHAWRSMIERRTIASLPEAPPGAPNVLLLILDTVRAANTSLNGYPRATTPNLDRRARDGVVFDWAFATSSWTLPSHSTIFTGRYPAELTANWNTPLDGTFPTLGEVLRNHGYATAAFVANTHYTSWHSGLGRGFTHLEDYQTSPYGIIRSATFSWTGSMQGLLWARSLPQLRAALVPDLSLISMQEILDLKSAEEARTDFLQWQRSNGGHPFFAFLNLFDVHERRAQGRFVNAFSRDTSNETQYDRALAYTDHEIDLLLRELEHRGVLDNTIVVIASDHGEQFGEHGLTEHGNSLYDQLLHVPLYMRYPARVPAGTRVTTVVSLRDLPRTLLDLAGVRDESIPGHSLADTWEKKGSREPRPAVAQLARGIRTPAHEPVSRGNMTALVDDSLHYIRNGDGVEELYAYRVDPAESHDLAKTPEARESLGRFRSLVAAMGRATRP